MIPPAAICFQPAWLVAILADMQVSWRAIARHGALPLSAIAAGGGAVAVVFWLRPDDYVNLVFLITVLAIAVLLVVASAFELVSVARRQPFGLLRAVVLAAPFALFVAALAGLQSMRLVGPLTIGAGALIVLLANYVLWPRDEA
ncbi:MAG: hypothetical protein U0556_14100 [Dehalococcoidia bacterium]